MAEPLRPSPGRDRQGKHGPSHRRAVANGGQHGQANYPVARPYAPPPPTSPYYKPMPTAVLPGTFPPSLPVVATPVSAPELTPLTGGARKPGFSRYWLEGLVLAGVVWLSMTAGWFFFRGPGRTLFASKAETEKSTVAVADASRPDASRGPHGNIPNPIPEPPRNPQLSRPTLPSKPTPEKPGATVPGPLKQSPPPIKERPTPPPTQEPQRPPLSNNVLTFEKHVLPIFQTKCISCHGAGKLSAKLDLRTVPAMIKGNASGTSLVPGKPDQSPIWETIKDGSMPKGPTKLTASEKRIIEQWIAGGARER